MTRRTAKAAGFSPAQWRAFDPFNALKPGDLLARPRGVRAASLRALVRAGVLVETADARGAPLWSLAPVRRRRARGGGR